jgi:putative oxidoreductase
MSVSEALSPFMGRLILGWFYLAQAGLYGGDWDNTVTLMNMAHIPVAPFMLAVSLLFLCMGSLSLIFGFHARYGALLLFAITVSAAVAMHAYWRINGDLLLRAAEFELFACHAAIAGGLLLIIGQGPGPLAIDNKRSGKKK